MGLEVYNTDTSNNLGKAVFAGNQGAEIKLQDTVSGETVKIAANGQASFYSEKAGDPMVFYTKPSGGSDTERLRITSKGMLEMRSDMSASDQANRNIFRFTDTDTSTTSNQSMGRLQWFSSDASGGGACVKARNNYVDTTPEANLIFKKLIQVAEPLQLKGCVS